MECYDDTTEALSKPSTYFLLSNTILQEEEPKLLAEMSSPKTETGNIQDEPGASYSDRKWEILKKRKPTIIVVCQRNTEAN